jgi:hypothetical protein
MINDIAPPGGSGGGSDEPIKEKFRPPETSDTEQEEIVLNAISSDPEKHKKMDFTPKSDKKKRFKLPKLTKKQWALVAGIVVILVGIIGMFIWKLTHRPAPVSQPVVIVQEPEKPKEFFSPLTGVKVSKEDSELPVTAIMIENSPDARPQSGLKDANVVFEAVAEGGITRFLTLFQEAKPDYIGPIRSVRPYYLDWLVAFDAPVAHVGGSPEALAQIRNEGIKDLDYGVNSSFYHRINERYAPHNVYTSRAELLELQKSKGWTVSKFTSWERKDDSPSTTVNAKALDFSISGFLYNPHFDYDSKTNSYLRSQEGKPHVDEKSGKQINPKVVVAIVLAKSNHPDGVHTVYGATGSGTAYIFQDGTVVKGTWEKKDRQTNVIFKSADGKTIQLNRGNTWVSAVDNEGAVTYTP